MIRDFSMEKKEELYRNLEVIDNKEWKPFMIWCGGRAGEFGVWADKLGISSYTRQIDNYQNRVLDTNTSTRNQIDVIFENVAETDHRYAEILRECAENVKEQIARIQVMTEVMESACGIGIYNGIMIFEMEQNSVSQREEMILKGREILMRRLESEKNISLEERQRICDIIMKNQPNMLINLYITDCYSSADSKKVYDVIIDYYNRYKKLDYAEEILRRYLITQGIVDDEEQQKIIDMIREKQPGMLMNLYITDCYSSTDSRLVEKAIMDYYNMHKMDITIDDVEGLDLGEGMDQTQKETFVACWNRLGQMGLSEEYIIAVMANIYAESRFSATNAQESYDYVGLYDDYDFRIDDEVGYGICQWTLEARKEALLDYANNNGGSVHDLETQLNYFQYEMEEGICAGYWKIFLDKETTYDAMYYFMDVIENPEVNNTEERWRYATAIEAWYSELELR